MALVYLFSKSINPRNFVFAKTGKDGALRAGAIPLQLEAWGGPGDIYHIRVRRAGEQCEDAGEAAGSGPAADEAAHNLVHGNNSRLKIGNDGSVAVVAGLRTFLSTLPGAAFGVSGRAWMFQFRQRSDMQF